MNPSNSPLSPIAKSFSVRITNKFASAKTIALFAGTIDTLGLATNSASKPILVDSNPEPVINYCQSTVDAVMSDGVLAVYDSKAGSLTIPDTSGGTDYIEVKALNPQFRVKDLKKFLISNGYIINRIIIKAKSQDQFDNPITLRTTSPTENLGSKTILPTNYSTPEMLQTTKIIINDIEGTILQDDTMITWQLDPNEEVNVTFEFMEIQQ